METLKSGGIGGRIWAGRVLRWLAILFLLFDALTKLFHEPHTVAQSAAMGITVAQLTGIGATLLAATVLYIIPRTAIFGGLFLTAYLGGAVATSVFKGAPVGLWFLPMAFGVVVWLGLYLRDGELRKLVPLRAEVSET